MRLHVPKTMYWQHSPAPSWGRLQNYWLYRPGALTNGLRALGTVKLRVLREFGDGLDGDERLLIQSHRGYPVWIREVCMAINGHDCVVARSFTPLTASKSVWQGIRRLRTRPLADMLYHDPRIERSHFVSTRIHRAHGLWSTLKHTGNAIATSYDDGTRKHALLARSSVFWRESQPLVVEECFLPAFWPLARYV